MTLMKMVEKNLNACVKEEEFNWTDIISGNNNDKSGEVDRLKSFLKKNYGLDWIDESHFSKEGKNRIIWFEDERIFKAEPKSSVSGRSNSTISQKVIDALTGRRNYVQPFEMIDIP